MSILSVCQILSSTIGIERPSAIVASTDREHQELADIAGECAQQLAEAFPWQKLRTLHTIAGDGTTTAYDLPSDFGWIPEGMEVRSDDAWGRIKRVTNHDEWLESLIRPLTVVNGSWTLLGGQIHFNPARASGEDVKFYYQSNEWADAAGTPQEGFTADTDTFRLSETMLRLCMAWKWKAYKKLPYQEELAVFTDDFAKRVTRDRGPRCFAVGARYTLADEWSGVAFPFTLSP